MKSISTLALLATLALVPCATCAAVPTEKPEAPRPGPNQNTPPPDVKPPDKSHGLAKASYTRKIDSMEVCAYATITARPDPPSDGTGLSLFAYFTSPGHDVKVPDAIQLNFTSESPSRLFEKQHELVITADDLQLLAADCVVMNADCDKRGCFEILRGPKVPIAVLRKVVGARHVTLAIGAQRYELSDEARQAIQDILAIGAD